MEAPNQVEVTVSAARAVDVLESFGACIFADGVYVNLAPSVVEQVVAAYIEMQAGRVEVEATP